MSAPDLLKSVVERIERLDEEGEAISNDKRDIYAESKAQGFDLAALKTVIARRRRRRKDPNKYEETQSIVEAYEAALWSGTENAPRARERAKAERPSAPSQNPDPSTISPERPTDAISENPDDLGIPPFLDRRVLPSRAPVSLARLNLPEDAAWAMPSWW